jgi:hypothetical protein
MLKKSFFIGVVCVSLAFFTTLSPGYALNVSIPNTNTPVGTPSVQIPVNVDLANGIAGFQFTVTFDPALLQATCWCMKISLQESRELAGRWALE